MSKIDLWARIEEATERAEDMARAERAYTRMRRAGVSEDTIMHSRRSARDTDPPAYVDEDGPEIVTTKALGNWIGWPRRLV